MTKPKPKLHLEINPSRAEALQRRLMTVAEAALQIRCTPRELHAELNRRNLGELEGVYRIFPGPRGIRIDLWLFLHHRLLPPAVLGDVAVTDSARMILAMAEPLLKFLQQVVFRAHGVYDSAARREEEQADA